MLDAIIHALILPEEVGQRLSRSQNAKKSILGHEGGRADFKSPRRRYYYRTRLIPTGWGAVGLKIGMGDFVGAGNRTVPGEAFSGSPEAFRFRVPKRFFHARLVRGSEGLRGCRRGLFLVRRGFAPLVRWPDGCLRMAGRGSRVQPVWPDRRWGGNCLLHGGRDCPA